MDVHPGISDSRYVDQIDAEVENAGFASETRHSDTRQSTVSDLSCRTCTPVTLRRSPV